MDLSGLCTGHAAFRHPVFDMLAKQPLTTCGMQLFWAQMKAFCDVTRLFGGLINTLDQLRLAEVAALLREIEESERGHAFELELCATKLISRTGQLETGMNHFLWNCRETENAVDHFELRHFVKTGDGAAYWLGATYALEVMANRHIIPGEIKAFVESGYYGLSLDELPYLAEHADDSVEARHERLMERALSRAIEAGYSRDEMERGITDTMDRINSFYDGVLRVSLHCPHPSA